MSNRDVPENINQMRKERHTLLISGLTYDEANRFLTLLDKLKFKEKMIAHALQKEAIDNDFETSLILLKTKLT